MDLKLSGQVQNVDIVRENFNKIVKAFSLVPASSAVWGSISGTITDQTDLTAYITSFGFLTSIPSHNHDAGDITTGILTQPRGGTGFGAYATGDMLYASATNVLSKLSVGTNGHVLTLASGVPTWAAAAGGSPAGSTGYIQFNSSGSFAADSNLFWDNTNKALAIGSTAPAITSILDLSSTTKGFLMPRMSTTQVNAITSPEEGLQVYDNTLHVPKFYNGSTWRSIGTGWNVQGNSGTSPSTDFIGTLDNQNLSFRIDNTKVGLLTPTYFMFGAIDFLVGAGLNTISASGIQFFIHGSQDHRLFSGYNTGTGNTNFEFYSVTGGGLATIKSGAIYTNYITASNAPYQYQGITIQGTAYPGPGASIVLNNSFSSDPQRVVVYGGASANQPVSILKSGDGNLIVGADYTGDISSAQLNVISTTKGFLVPRMTSSQVSSIASPAEALQAYDTTLHCLNMHNGTAWQYLLHAANNTKTTAGAPYINDGYVSVNIGGTVFKLMTTA